MRALSLLLLLHVTLLTATAQNGALPALDEVFETAYSRTRDGVLTVGTGNVERSWKWTGKGLVTVRFADTKASRTWTNREPAVMADWAAPGWIDDHAEAEMISLTAKRSNDQKFTSDHLEVVAEVLYPETDTTIRYVIWAYPNAPGIRTQLFVKGGAKVVRQKKSSSGHAITLLHGKPFTAKMATKVAPRYFASAVRDDKEVSFRVEGLKQDRTYAIGISWWDFAGTGRKQKVALTSVDGEANVEVVAAKVLPNYSKRKEMPASEIFEIPLSVNMDGSATVLVGNQGGPSAVVCEAWLYEVGAETQADIDVDPDRRKDLDQLAPHGSELVAYIDFGETNDNKKSVKPQDIQLAEQRRSDYLPVTPEGLTVRAIGYYNDTQHRNVPGKPIYREEVLTEPMVYWANMLVLEDDKGGCVMLKESHKCVQQYGVDTGVFNFDENGLVNTGWSFTREEAKSDEFLWCWASWLISYEGGEDERELAVKRFDRMRYPTDIERDMWTVACTWGDNLTPRDGRDRAQEKEVLAEMESVADLGIDMLLIDDGWQVSFKAGSASPSGDNAWKPHPEPYPEGWSNVIEKKNKLNLRLGLWGIAQSIPLHAMIWNWEQLKMNQIKLDFAWLGSHEAMDNLMRKSRAFMLASDHKCVISWDVTEAVPRYGYYWAREYGNVHFMNRKLERPVNVIYVPWLALRDFWLLSKYNNLNKWQLVTNVPSDVDMRHSDAYKHSAGYCTATTLMGIPQFFAVTRNYNELERVQIKSLLATYKQHRRSIFESFVYPIGDEPTNGSWTGFQTYDEKQGRGYLTVFREIKNAEKRKHVALRFLRNVKVELENLRDQTKQTVDVGPEGEIALSIDRPADFLFLKYKVID